jgi:hypothetical protein
VNSEQFLREVISDVLDGSDRSVYDYDVENIIESWTEKLDELIADEVAKEVELDKEL